MNGLEAHGFKVLFDSHSSGQLESLTTTTTEVQTGTTHLFIGFQA
jgi:hypothetical protein